MIAWIRIDDTNVHYPVMQGKDNIFYRDHDWQDEESKPGSIFLDYRNSKSLKDKYNVCYGKTATSGRFFSDLKDFENEKWGKAHAKGRMFVPGGEMELTLVAYAEVSEFDMLYAVNTMNELSEDGMKQMIKDRAKYTTPELEKELGEDTLVAASTVGSENQESVAIFRMKVVK